MLWLSTSYTNAVPWGSTSCSLGSHLGSRLPFCMPRGFGYWLGLQKKERKLPAQPGCLCAKPCFLASGPLTLQLTLVARYSGSPDPCAGSGRVLPGLHGHHSPLQEPGPAKMAVTSSSSSIPSAEKVPTTKSTLWQEEMRAKDQPDGSSLSPAQSPSQGQPPVASTLREPGLEGRDGKW